VLQEYDDVVVGADGVGFFFFACFVAVVVVVVVVVAVVAFYCLIGLGDANSRRRGLTSCFIFCRPCCCCCRCCCCFCSFLESPKDLSSQAITMIVIIALVSSSIVIVSIAVCGVVSVFYR